MRGTTIRGELDKRLAAVSARTALLAGELERLSRDTGQPSAALQARTLQLQMQLVLALAKGRPTERILREFREVVGKCEGLAGFPLESLVEILTELGELFGGLPAYDELFETVLAVQARRRSEVVAAGMLLVRGEQQLRADRPYNAIRTLGLSLRRFYKHESRADAVHALYSCGCAYERVGLLWAARGTLLSAASLAAGEWWKYGDVTISQAACYRRIKWLELQLGRIPQALSWHEVDMVVRAILIEKGAMRNNPSKEDVAFDAVFGLLLLKTDHWELKRLSSLPDVLDRLGLFSASVALTYALGYEDELREIFFREVGAKEDMHAFFVKWRDQPASKDLPERPSLYEGKKVTLKSRVLGCDVTVESDNLSPCVELSESLLAALESLLSTGTVEHVAAREPVLTIDVRRSDFAKQPFEFELRDDTGRPHVNITCAGFDPHILSTEVQTDVRERLTDLLTNIFARIVVTHDFHQVLERLFRDELALDRSVNFAGSFITVANVLGREPKSRVSSWSDPEAREYPNARTEAWDAHVPRAAERTQSNAKPLTPGKDNPPDDLFDRSNVRQSEIQTVSLIRETLWNKAKWSATVFGTAADEASPPILALAFKDAQGAKQIFHFWRGELGEVDAEERLRIAIIRGISRTHPYWYKVLVGSNHDLELSRQGVRYAAFVSRINKMQPDSGDNLERFLRSYERFKGYFLMPGALRAAEPEILYGSALFKRELHVRQAWEIGRNDPDGVAIHPDDGPLIPDGQENAPVLALLKWKQERSKA
jgi:hypothetical protein